VTRPSQSSTLVDDLAVIRSWSFGAQGVASAEIDTINVLIGDGVNVITPGVAVAIRADFNAFITGGFVHEFDGLTGSISISIDKAAYAVGSAPSFTSIVASSPLVVSSARYGENLLLTGWTREIDRGDVLRFLVNSATSFARVLVALRIWRLEP
jgi:hypothetical protein